jgi:PRC-barrel domain
MKQLNIGARGSAPVPTAAPVSAAASISIAALVWIAVLAGCSSMRAAPHPSPPPSSPPAAVEAPPQPQPTDSGATESNNDVQPETTSVPPCTCAELKTKPKPKPKPRPVHREAPPPLPAAPVATDTALGVVDAQVKTMSVSVMSILGKKVQGPKGEDLGRVVDVLADSSGRVRVAIIDFGGFLGVGDRRIAVDWPLLRFNPDSRDPSLLLSVNREQLKVAPEYKDNPRPQTLMEPPASVPPPTSSPPEIKK